MKTIQSRTKLMLALFFCGASALTLTASARTVERLATGTIDFVAQFNGPANVFLDKITLEPGDIVSYHFHPGDAVNVVTQGTVTLINRCSSPKNFSVGKTFIEESEVVHTITNERSGPAVFFAEVIGPGGVVGFVDEPDCSIKASLKPLSLSFGPQTVNTRQTQSIRLSNTGTAALTLFSLELTGPNAGSFRLADACGSSLAVGKSCLIDITFGPKGVGPKSAALRVVAADNIVLTRELTGNGIN